MFHPFKKLNNESGIILFIVLMTAIIIMIFSVGILTQSMNESNYAQQQIDQINCDQQAKGEFWNLYSIGGLTAIPNGGTIALPPITISGRTYTATATAGNPVLGINSYTVQCSYDTFS